MTLPTPLLPAGLLAMYDFPVLCPAGALVIHLGTGASCRGPHHATPSRSGPSTRFRHGPKADFVYFLLR